MSNAYADAAERHFKDALALKSQGRLDNAGHLIGFSAECAIKSAIILSATGVAPFVHLPGLLTIARKRLKSRTANHRLLFMLNTNAFNNWDVARRYHPSGDTTSVELDSWVGATRQLLASAGIKSKS